LFCFTRSPHIPTFTYFPMPPPCSYSPSPLYASCHTIIDDLHISSLFIFRLFLIFFIRFFLPSTLSVFPLIVSFPSGAPLCISIIRGLGGWSVDLRLEMVFVSLFGVWVLSCKYVEIFGKITVLTIFCKCLNHSRLRPSLISQ